MVGADQERTPRASDLCHELLAHVPEILDPVVPAEFHPRGDGGVGEQDQGLRDGLLHRSPRWSVLDATSA